MEALSADTLLLLLAAGYVALAGYNLRAPPPTPNC